MLLLLLAIRNLTRRRVRTILTVMGVAIAISFTVGILSISEGFMASFENSMAQQGTDIIIVPKEAEAYPYPDVAAFVGSFSEETLREIEQYENVRAVYPVLTAVPMTMPMDKIGAIPILNGVTPAYFSDVAPYLRLSSGRLITGDDQNVLVAGSGIADVAGLELGGTMEIRGIPFEVVGILEPSGGMDDGMIFTPLEPLQKAYDKEGQLTYVPVKVDDVARAEETAEGISEKWPGVSAQTMTSVIDKLVDLVGIVRAAHMGMSAVALLIGILFILSTMLMAVGERVREIGTMRAIGAHRGFIFRMIVMESLATSLIAGGIGCLGGYLLSQGITYVLSEFMGLTYFAPVVNARIFGIGLAIALLVGMLAGLYPAWRISKTNIVQALRYE
ncbi:MAG TPA: ABC transporter permease [Dehalococcoidales bacterium]|nr:ABC transporter permease [Dehalococcoidales bacterium]